MNLEYPDTGAGDYFISARRLQPREYPPPQGRYWNNYPDRYNNQEKGYYPSWKDRSCSSWFEGTHVNRLEESSNNLRVNGNSTFPPSCRYHTDRENKEIGISSYQQQAYDYEKDYETEDASPSKGERADSGWWSQTGKNK